VQLGRVILDDLWGLWMQDIPYKSLCQAPVFKPPGGGPRGPGGECESGRGNRGAMRDRSWGSREEESVRRKVEGRSEGKSCRFGSRHATDFREFSGIAGTGVCKCVCWCGSEGEVAKGKEGEITSHREGGSGGEVSGRPRKP